MLGVMFLHAVMSMWLFTITDADNFLFRTPRSTVESQHRNEFSTILYLMHEINTECFTRIPKCNHVYAGKSSEYAGVTSGHSTPSWIWRTQCSWQLPFGNDAISVLQRSGNQVIGEVNVDPTANNHSNGGFMEVLKYLLLDRTMTSNAKPNKSRTTNIIKEQILSTGNSNTFRSKI